MGQIKKDAVRVQILSAADAVFEEKGYFNATMAEIARRAKVSSANIYVYFPSKLEIAYAVFYPWLQDRIARVYTEAAAIADPRTRLSHVLRAVWHDIPAERNNYLINLLQALTTANSPEDYAPRILNLLREQLKQTIVECMPDALRVRVDVEAIAHTIVMAFDGFVLNAHLRHDQSCSEDMIESWTTLLAGPAARPGRKSTR